MPKFVTLEKCLGETPLHALDTFKSENPEYAELPATYAGRLDPLASGKLLVLIGEECKRKDVYTALDKEYEFEVLLRLRSDTGDLLGLVEEGEESQRYGQKMLRRLARSIQGAHTLPYPAYSSKTVDGIPLFTHAKQGTLGSIEIPKAATQVYSMRFLDMRKLSAEELLEKILAKLVLVEGNGFRNDEIASRWSELLRDSTKSYVIARFRTRVSSGTYIRTLAPLMAERLGTIGLAYSIHRSKIGKYIPLVFGSGFWTKTY